jgi:hypothetical protein
MNNNFSLSACPQSAEFDISESGALEKLMYTLRRHQKLPCHLVLRESQKINSRRSPREKRAS